MSTAAAVAVSGSAWARPGVPASPSGTPFVEKDTLVVNVLDHGATGDGSTDDTQALQAALDAGRGRTVYIPPGVYLVSTMLSVFSGTTVLATATSVVRRTDGPSILGNGVLGDMTATKFDGESNIVIQGGVWDVNARNVARNANAFSFSHGRNIRVYDVRVLDVQGWHAMELNAVETVRVANSRFEGFSDPAGNRQYSEAVHMDYAGGAGHFTLFGAPDFYGCKDIEVIGCYSGPSADFPSYPRLVGSHGGPDGHQHTGLRVISNYADQCSEWAIRLYDWLDGVVEGNQIADGGGGIQIGPAGVQTGGNIVVRGNTLRKLTGVQEADGRPPDAAICIGRLNNSRTHRLTVTGNIVEDVDMEGIAVYRTDGAVVSANVVEDCAGVGIRVNDAPRAVVTSNSIRRTGREGVVVHAGSNGALVSGNLTEDTGAYGMSITNAVEDVVVRDNILLGSGTADGTVAALRVSNNANRVTLAGNTVRRRDSGAHAEYGISITSTCTGTWYTGNDLRDSGATAAVSDQGSDSSTDPAGLS
nr:right-handed parallel beta-helix repeat-containing protein [Phytoactinopolyspora alkaliphila]